MSISCCVLLLLAWTQLTRAYGSPNYVAIPEHWRVYNKLQTAATQSISTSSVVRSGSSAGPAHTITSQTINWTAGSRTGGNSSKYDHPYTVCVGQWTPMTTCTEESTQEEYTGEQIGSIWVLAPGSSRVATAMLTVAVLSRGKMQCILT